MTDRRSTSAARRLLSVVAAAALGLSGAAIASTAASATDAPNPGNIDPSASRSIIIHKHETQSSTDVTASPDGTVAIPSPGIADVEFTVYPILDATGAKVDLTVPENWDFLSALQLTGTSPADLALTGGPAAADPAGEYSPGPWKVDTADGIVAPLTDENGLSTLAVDSIGAYAVLETAAPAEVVKKALPFIVTVPYPYKDGWLYDVNVYPKNSVGGIEKTITPQPVDQLGLGSVVKFPVTTSVPAVAAGDHFTGYIVEDTLDSRLGNLKVASVQVDGTDVPAENYTVETNGQTVTVTFTAAGLTWLEQQGGKSVVTTFSGTVQSLGNGVIENEATVFVNDPDKENGIDSNQVHTNWGDLKVKKVDSSKPGATLKGAIFEVYAAEPPYPADEASCTSATPTGAALTVSGKKTFESDGTGIVNVAGLFVSDSENAPVDAGFRCYVVKEIQAPAGFVTPTGTAANTGVAVKTGATSAVDITVKNTQQEVPPLPLTGSAGTLVLTVSGVALIAVAAGVLLVARRRTHSTKQ